CCPDLAVNASGDAVVGLQAGTSSQAATWRVGRGAWEAATDISQRSYSAAVAIDGVGNGLAIWEGVHDDGSEVVEASLRPVGSAARNAPVDLGPYDLGPKGFVPLRVAFDAAGNAIALWSTAAGVWGSYRPFGGSWQPTVSVWP